MAKAAGIIALILGIVALSPLPFWLSIQMLMANPVALSAFLAAAALGGYASALFTALWPVLLFGIVAIVLGIIGVATAKEDSKAPGIIGIVFGGVGIFLNIYVWPIIILLIMAASLGAFLP